MEIQDDVTGGGTGLLRKIKLTRELIELRQKIGAAGDGPMAAMSKLKLTRRIIEIRIELGARAEPVAAPGAPELDALKKIAAGEFDSDSLQGLYSRIAAAVNSLHALDLLSGDAETAAHAAIDHWARLEENADV